ncbi:aminoglycoside phosphotransferase family protein [bacterium]|nr:aminoglycoside phosphotransferase family protein [bacterium]
MVKTWEAQKIDIDEARLHLTVKEVLQDALGRSVVVSSMNHEPSSFATLSPANILHIGLQSGEKISLFLKHIGSEESEHPDKKGIDREIRIYDELIRDDCLPVAKYYGSKWNDKTKRRELFLEYIDDWNLQYHDLEHWFTAARRLAHFHMFFANQAKKLLNCEYLLRFDDVYLCEWAGMALSAVADQSGELAKKLEYVVSNYDLIAEVLTHQPWTLVHNDLSPKNVIADRRSRPARICFIDWEMAGVGCGLMDLVHLKYGLDPKNDRIMFEAYCAELTGTDLLPSNQQDSSNLLAACELHKTIYRLAHSKIWDLSIETVAQWVIEAEQFLSRVRE